MVFRCGNEPSSLASLKAVKLAWPGDVVQETSAESNPHSNGAAESSDNVRQRACQIDARRLSRLRVCEVEGWRRGKGRRPRCACFMGALKQGQGSTRSHAEMLKEGAHAMSAGTEPRPVLCASQGHPVVRQVPNQGRADGGAKFGVKNGQQ